MHSDRGMKQWYRGAETAVMHLMLNRDTMFDDSLYSHDILKNLGKFLYTPKQTASSIV
jgi:hypothetical protein